MNEMKINKLTLTQQANDEIKKAGKKRKFINGVKNFTKYVGPVAGAALLGAVTKNSTKNQ